MVDELIYVYKSKNKLRSYLYINQKDVFSHIPSGLLDAFGTPEYVLMFALSKDRILPKVSYEELKNAMETKGYFVRIDLDDVEENMLNEERKRKGLPPLDSDKIADYFH